MALSYGLTNPAAFIKRYEIYPDLFKFYTVVPTRSTESTAANQRRPVLYTSLNGGSSWNYESQSSGFYWVNYGGNFYFNSNKYHLEAWAHKSSSSSYGAYKASCGTTEDQSGIKLSTQGWSTSSVVAYNTANQPNREICKNIGITYPNRYFCIKEGGGYVYNNDPWTTANWTTTSFNTSGTTLSDDGGFKHICVDLEKDHDALVFFTTNDSNKYLRFYLCNLDNLTSPVDYTTTIFGDSTHKQADYKYCSIDFLPGFGYLIFYTYSSESRWCVKRLLTHDLTTGEKLPYNQYVLGESYTAVGTSGIAQSGSHGWYCPWTKEYFFVPNASQVFWTKDGINWNSSNTTGASTSTACVKFMTDGTNMVIATSGSAYYYSMDKGTTWNSGNSLSPDGFNTSRSTDTIVLPFKCVNNIGIDTSNLSLGYTLDSNTGQPVANAANFYANEYVPINSNTSYVVYGKNKTTKLLSYYVSIAWYDSSKNFISRSDTTNVYRVGIFTSPSNAVYARICCNLNDTAVTQEAVDSYKWYFAKEDDFKVMTNYGDIVCN